MSFTIDDLIDEKAAKMCYDRGVYALAAREAVANEIRRRIVERFSYDTWSSETPSQSLSSIIERYEQ